MLSLAFTKFGSKELLGQYQLVLSIMAMVSICSLLGLNAAALEAIVRGRDAGILKAVRLIFSFSLIGIPCMIAIGFFYIFFKDEVLLGETLIFAGLLFPIFYALGAWNNYYEGKLLFKESSLRAILLNLVLAVFLMIGIFYQLNVFWLVALFLSGSILFQGAYFIEIFRKIKDRSDVPLDIRFGFLFSLQKFSSGLSANLPPLVLSFLFGIELLAIYYIAYYVISAIASFLGSLITLYMPVLFKGIKLDHRSIILNNVFVGMVLWLIFIVFLKYFFILIYGEAYRESLELAYGISLLLLFMPLHTYLVSFFSTQKRNGFLVAIFCIANVAGLLAIHSAKAYGFFGATVIYLYILELATTLPLLGYYIYNAKKQMPLVKSA